MKSLLTFLVMSLVVCFVLLTIEVKERHQTIQDLSDRVGQLETRLDNISIQQNTDHEMTSTILELVRHK